MIKENEIIYIIYEFQNLGYYYIYSLEFSELENETINAISSYHDFLKSLKNNSPYKILNLTKRRYHCLCTRFNNIIKGWKRNYIGKYCDTGFWKLSIKYRNKKYKYFKGDNSFPENFEKFEKFFENIN